MENLMTKWHTRYLEMAELISTWSKDPRKQVGAVITKNNFIIGLGFNGFPSNIEDTQMRLHNRELKNKLMIHAEVNAILSAREEGDTIYVYPCLPCMACLMVIMQKNIKTIVSSKQFKNKPSQWDKELVSQIAYEHSIGIIYA